MSRLASVRSGMDGPGGVLRGACEMYVGEAPRSSRSLVVASRAHRALRRPSRGSSPISSSCPSNRYRARARSQTLLLQPADQRRPVACVTRSSRRRWLRSPARAPASRRDRKARIPVSERRRRAPRIRIQPEGEGRGDIPKAAHPGCSVGSSGARIRARPSPARWPPLHWNAEGSSTPRSR